MRPKQRETAKSDDLFRARLEQIIDMKHELVQLAGKIDWTSPAPSTIPRSTQVALSNAEISRGSLSTRPFNPRTSRSRPTPSCCMRRSRG